MNSSKNINDLKKWIILIIVAIASYWSLNNLNIIGNFIKTIFSVFLPFILGGAIAYILNIPATKIENYLVKQSKNNKTDRGIQLVSIIISLLIFFLVIIFIAFTLIPELVNNLQLLINSIPSLLETLENNLLNLAGKYPDVQVQIKEFFSANSNVGDIISNLLNYILNGAVGFVSSLVSGFITFFTAIIFSIYMLSQKEYLLRCSKKIIYVIFNKKQADKLLSIGTLANKTFSKFISGQCVEAIILGAIIFVACLIFRFPYALLIAVLTTITALIPIFGAFIAAGVGTILIGIVNPLKAIIFIGVFLIIQQIEGNLIYPKVVGKSVGLSPLWTLLAITVGGNLFGVLGMLLGLPIASIAYTIIKELINNKLTEKKINIE